MTDRATTSVFEDALCEVAAGIHRFGALGAGTGPAVGEICPGRWSWTGTGSGLCVTPPGSPPAR